MQGTAKTFAEGVLLRRENRSELPMSDETGLLSGRIIIMLKSIRWTALTLCGCAGFFALAETSAWAQFGTSGQTTSSAFGSRTLGGSTSANRTGRSTGASNAGSLNGLSGAGGQGQQGAGTGTGAPTGERYVRGNRTGSFVGADTGDGALNSYSAQAGGAGGLGGMMGNQMMMQAFRQSQNQNQNQSKQNAKTTLRTAFKVGFETPPVMTAAATSRLQVRYANLPALKGKSRIEAVMEGDTLVLRGQVQSAADKELAEDLLSLEPGVGQVRNELEIVQSSSAPRRETPVSVNSAESLESANSAAPTSGEPSAPKRVSRPLER